LALAKNPMLRKGDQAACTFLLRTRTGEHRCGLGDLRPTGCRTFPLELCDGLVGVQPEHGCTCRQWSLADVDTVAERPLLEARLAESEAYCEVVARWNAGVATLPDSESKRFDQYCEYLLEVYDLMEELALADVVES
jgi:Fe-S-cluster containining protein